MQLHRRESDPLFDAFPGLETDRLCLRRLSVSDAPALFDMLANPEVARFTARKPLKRVSDAVDMLRGVGLDYATRRSIRWGVTLSGSDKIIATVGLHDWDRYHRHVSIGFDLHHEHWGQGYGQEMVSAVCAYAFDHMSVHRIEAHVMKGNRSSKRLLESVGFEMEGVMRKRMYKDGHQHDLQLYALVIHRTDLMH
jgi:ribosomal-protein-alanine N-acetyltransferase